MDTPTAKRAVFRARRRARPVPARRKFASTGGIARRFKSVVARSGVKSLREADRLARLTPGHAHAIATGSILDPRTSSIAAYAQVFGCSLDWLVWGVGKAPRLRAIRLAIAGARARLVADAPPAEEVAAPTVAADSHLRASAARGFDALAAELRALAFTELDAIRAEIAARAPRAERHANASLPGVDAADEPRAEAHEDRTPHRHAAEGSSVHGVNVTAICDAGQFE